MLPANIKLAILMYIWLLGNFVTLVTFLISYMYYFSLAGSGCQRTGFQWPSHATGVSNRWPQSPLWVVPGVYSCLIL